LLSPEISPPHADGDAAGPGTPPTPHPGKGAALALLICVVITAVGCLITVYTAAPTHRLFVAWLSGIGAGLLCIAVTTATYGLLVTRRLRAVMAANAAEAERDRTLATHFVDVTVPRLVERLRSGESAQTAMAAMPSVGHETLQRVLQALATEVHRGEGMRAAAMAACANAAGRVQALATSMAADLREMEHKYADEDVLGDLMHLDHRTAQTGRLADSIAVLTGARTGRRWAKPIVMESILRGAMGRISGYQRVRLHSSSTLAVAGHAAEGVMHVLAELMDNAANFSPPTSDVHVYVEEVSTGAVVTIEDGGLVMSEVALRRAEAAVSADQGDLTSLSGTRLGLAVVGRLARKHGLSVSFRPSAHGGTGVLLMIPQTLVSNPDHKSEGTPGQRSAGPQRSGGRSSRTREARQGRAASREKLSSVQSAQEPEREPEYEPEPEPDPEPRRAAGLEYGESGLPKRRRGQTLAAATATATSAARGEPEPAPGTSAPAPARSASRFGTFRRAVRGATPPEEQGFDDDAPSASPAPSSSLPEDSKE
jgi:signal transduction histidine kinase